MTMDLKTDLARERENSDFLFIVFFRGHLCPFCISYLRALEQLRPSIDAVSGRTIAITAEPDQYLSETRTNSGYQGSVPVDTSHVLASSFREGSIVDIAITAKGGYQNGMAQPAIIVLRKTADGRDEVLYHWAIVPSMMNLGGAKDRPVLSQVWENVEAKLKNQSEKYSSVSKTSFVGMVWEKFFG